MELIQVRDTIEQIISAIGKARKEIETKGNARAKAISDYDKRLEIAIRTLRDEGKFPVTLIEKIAKGVCAPEREKLELAEVAYKGCISNLEALKAQLNGYQSIFRYME